MCLIPPIEQATTEISSLATPDLEWWNARLCWTNAIPPLGRQPSTQEAQEYWRQCKLVPRQAWWYLGNARRPTYLTCGEPLTHLPCLAHLHNQVVRYPDGSVFRYADLPGLGDPSYRLDKLTWTTSVALVAHEAGHAVDQYVLGWESNRVRFRHIWEQNRHLLPTIYVRDNPQEAWAEGFAVWGIYWNREHEFPWPKDFWHHYNHVCIVERGWSFWSPTD